ncbi:hypothetical protein ACLKA6_012484 [Drosophila palustris]
MKLVNQRDHAIHFLRRKLRSLLESFQEDCQTSYEEAAQLLFHLGLEDLQMHIKWLEYYNDHAPLLKWNSINNYIELHYPSEGRVLKTTITEYTKLTIYLQQESLEMPRKKAYYLIEMLHCAHSLHQLTLGGALKPLEPLVQNLLFLDDTIEKFHYLVYQLLPLYRDHIRLHCD